MAATQKILSRSEEYCEIPDTPSPSVNPRLYRSGLDISNKGKNRYSNIIALDETRVKLEGRESDYINANYVDVGDCKFIVSQAPMPYTFDDFWWMIWSHKTEVIGMFTSLVEKGRTKAHIYWPRDQNNSRGFLSNAMTIVNRGEETVGDFTLTTLSIYYSNDVHTLTHYHYKGWPDFGIPDNTTDIRRFLDVVARATTPVVIHCSAGCGRAGTICAIYRHLHTNEEIKLVVENLRKFRHSLVQTKDQYKYIHKVVEAVKARGLKASE